MWPERSEQLPKPKTLSQLRADDVNIIADHKREHRGWHDILCSLLFVVVLGICTSIISIAFTYGNPDTLLAPTFETVVWKIEGFTMNEVATLANDYKAIICSFLASLIVAFCWFQLFKRLALWMMYATLAVAIVGLSVLGGYLFVVYRRYNNLEFFFLALIFWAIALATLIVGVALRGKLQFTAQLIKEASNVLQRNPNILGVVGTTFLAYAALCAIWIGAFIYLYTVPSNVHIISTASEPSAELLNQIWNQNYRGLFWVLFLAAFWITSMVLAVEQYVVASITIQQLQLDAGHRTRPSRSITAIATKEAFTTSFGSLAFGSSIVGLAYFLNIFRRYIATSQQFPGRDNFVVKLVVRFFTFLIEVVTDFAYIYIALSGKSFLSSSRHVTELLRTELAQLIVTEVVLSYLLTVGQLACTALVTLGLVVAIDLINLHVGIITVLAAAMSAYFLFSVVSKAILVCTNSILVFVLQDLHEHRQDAAYKSPESVRNIILAKLVGHNEV